MFNLLMYFQTEEEKIEESVPLESGGSAYNDSELLQYINELHEQLKSKDDHIGWNFLSIRLTQLVKLVKVHIF